MNQILYGNNSNTKLNNDFLKDNNANNRCIAMYSTTRDVRYGKWRAHNCSVPRPFVCRLWLNVYPKYVNMTNMFRVIPNKKMRSYHVSSSSTRNQINFFFIAVVFVLFAYY